MKAPKKGKSKGGNALMTMGAPMPAPMEDEMKYKAQDALHTLKRAHEIKSDPHLMAHVHKHAQSEKEALHKIIGRKKKA
jgi:hypothetical protein